MIWSRPRVGKTRIGSKTIIFDPKARDRLLLGISLRPHFQSPMEGPLKLEMEFRYQTPRKKLRGSYKETKPDIDNLIKAICDCLNKFAYYDDAQVSSIQATKHWSDKDETLIRVIKL